jgi:hypothetical protein
MESDHMPPRSLLRAFLALWLVTGCALLTGSLLTLRAGLGPAPHAHHLATLGAVEAVAAALFLVPRTMRPGALGLLLTIGVAFAAHAALGQFRGDLLVFAAAVAFVAVHRPLTREQLRSALLGGGA